MNINVAKRRELSPTGGIQVSQSLYLNFSEEKRMYGTFNYLILKENLFFLDCFSINKAGYLDTIGVRHSCLLVRIKCKLV